MRSPSPSSPPADVDWSAHLDALERSGLSVQAYARAHGIKPDTLYKARRRRLSAAASTSTRLVPITVETATLCEFTFRDGCVLRFPTSLDASTLTAWVAALRTR